MPREKGAGNLSSVKRLGTARVLSHAHTVEPGGVFFYFVSLPANTIWRPAAAKEHS